MNLTYKKKRRIAWIVTSVIAILSVFILGGWKLSNKCEKVEEYFFNGKNGFSIANDIDVRVECGYNLLTVSDRLSLDTNAVDELRSALADTQNALTIREYYKANEALTFAFDSLYTQISQSEADESVKRLAAKQADEFSSRLKTIQKDPYNEKALAFNEELNHFPANLIAFLSGTDPVDLFRNGG